MKSGYVSLVGRPNVGKSTLLNALLEMKLAITSNKAQTTRNVIQGVYNDPECQIVFVDTPGIHKPKHKLGNILNRKAYLMTEEVDLVLLLIDVEAGFGRGDQFIIERLKEESAPVILLLNKVDRVKKESLLKIMEKLNDIYPFKEIIPISALKNDNLDTLIKVIKKYLPREGKLYEENVITNVSTKFYVSEILREKVLRLTEEEVPHSVTCVVETLEEEENIVRIQALIIVDRDSLKKIIIGKGGSLLQQIGFYARTDLEEYFGKKVYLENFVKTIPNWRDREKYLQELGLSELDS